MIGIPAALMLAALVAAASAPQQEPEPPIELRGKCVANPALPNLMKQRDGVTKVTTVECDRVVIQPGKQAIFYRGAKRVAAFEGHAGDESDITMDRVAIGTSEPAPTTNGRCRIYKDDGQGEVMMLCFAVYRDGNTILGAAAIFSGPAR